MQIVRRAAPGAAAAVAIAALAYAFLGRSLPDYDAMYALVWGEDVASGRAPQVELPFAPALHPLSVAVGALLSPLGDEAAGALRAFVLLSFGAACVGLFRLGEVLFGTAAGALAAAAFATRSEALALSSQAFVDIPAAALVVWAAVLEARSSRRGIAVAALLALASLLRPEVFVLAVAYVAWMWLGRDRAAARRTALVAACAPLAWIAFDGVVTGEPLGALTRRNATLAQVGSQSGLLEAVETLARGEWGFIRPTLLVAAAAGLAWAIARRRSALAIPVAVGALDALAFLGLGVAGQPIEPRYLAPLSAMVALLAGAGLAAALAERPRRLLVPAAVALLALSTVLDARRAIDLRDGVRTGLAAQDDLEAIAATPAVAALPALAVPTPRPVPVLAFFGDDRPAAFTGSGARARLEPLTAAAAQLLVRGIPDDDAREPAPPTPVVAPLARTDSWAVVPR